MVTAVLMPQVGQDIKTAKIIEWLKRENDSVNKGDIVAVVESEKAAFDVEAYESGVLLKILYEEGQEVEVLTPIAYIGQPGEEIEKAPVSGEAEARLRDGEPLGAAASAQTTESKAGVTASPSARKLAREGGINLKAITGTGPGGRITKKDVLAAVSAQCREQPTVADEDTVVPFSPMRARIAQRLTHSKQNIPHFYVSVDVDMSQALGWKDRYEERSGAKVTITDMITKATATALSEFRTLNAHVEADKIILKGTINIGVAVAVKKGLIVPVIPATDKESITEIATISRENAEAAKAGRLKPTSPGTFTITNLGMYGIDTFVPIINPPECAILAVGSITKKPAAVNDAVAIRPITTLTLACDHRAVDGTYAAQFLEKVKYYLENPSSLED